jgi:hypothetical protein
MRKFGRTLLSFIFWSYERGSIQYDIAVILIVVFVLASPRGWFHDRPQEASAKPAAGVALIATDSSTGVQTYQVDTRSLASPIPEPELEHLVHDAVRKNVPSLQGRPFHIVGMRPVFNSDGQIVFYEVSLKP